MQLSVTVLQFRVGLARPLAVSPGKYANVVRGAMGMAFRQAYCKPECAEPDKCPLGRVCEYAQVFEGDLYRRSAPGGMQAAPRPFVLRVDAQESALLLRIHLLGDAAGGLVPIFTTVVARVAASGLGPGRVPVQAPAEPEIERVNLSLDPLAEAPARIRIHFLTPTELKTNGKAAEGVPFAALMGRARDRVLFFAAAGDCGLLARELAKQAATVRQVGTELQYVVNERLSTRTGQRHGLSGFVGHADYDGDFRTLLPWLRAAEWTGVGRQTVWGNGRIRCEPASR